MAKILFINTMHNSLDDRTFHHHAKSLAKSGHEIFIFSTNENLILTENRISIISKKINNLTFTNQLKKLGEICKSYQPEKIICDSPTGILAAKTHYPKAERIYDITEWIPSKKHLANTKKLLYPFKFCLLVILNYLAVFCSNKLLFGEYYKAVPFKFVSKNKLISTYYPDLKYIQSKPQRDISNGLKLYYSGWFNIEKGFDKVLQFTTELAKLQPTKDFELFLRGEYRNQDEEMFFSKKIDELPENVKFKTGGFIPFNEFCTEITETDLFLDFRVNDFENTHCLPIKLFYYMACGRPVLYSDLKAIKKELDINQIGFSFKNNCTKQLAKNVNNYFSEPEIYAKHCSNALQLSVNNYNWAKIESEFLNFINA